MNTFCQIITEEWRLAILAFLDSAQVDCAPFIESQLASTQLTLPSHILQIRSRYPRIFG